MTEQAAILRLSQRFHEHENSLWWRSAPEGVKPISPAPDDHASTITWARSQPSQFAAVIHTDEAVHLVTDFARSIPLFYTRIDNHWIVSDEIDPLIKAQPAARRDDEAAEVFRHCAVVLGTRTLVKGIYQVPAATVVTLPHDCDEPVSELYWSFSYSHDFEGQDENFEARMIEVLRAQFRSLVEIAGDRLLAIPLSGGIDSRLLALFLAEYPHANLLAFTYGQKDSHEVRVSERVAQDLNIPWVFVESAPDAVRAAWHEHGKPFLDSCWAGASLPHYQDWYALHVLTLNGTLPPGSIIVPGHTIVGNLHDSAVLDDPSPMGTAAMTRLLLEHHGTIQGSPDALAKIPYVHAVMAEFFAETGYDGSPEQRQDIIECFNLRERQAKYINNSMRPYEYFGLDWALPMLNTPFIELWQQAPREASDEQRLWYKHITNHLYEQRTGAAINYFTSTVDKLPPRWKQLGITIAEHTGVAEILRRALSAKTQADHPMAFHALLDDDNATRIIVSRTLRGSSLQGEFVDRFLNGSWLPGAPALPPSD